MMVQIKDVIFSHLANTSPGNYSTGPRGACLQELEDAIDVHWPFHSHGSNNPQTLKHVDHHTDRACRTDQSGSLCRHGRVHEVIRQHQACTERSNGSSSYEADRFRQNAW